MAEVSGKTSPSFSQLLDLLVYGNRPSQGYSGTYLESDAGGELKRWQVWRLGDCIRMDDEDGKTFLLADEEAFIVDYPASRRRVLRSTDNWIDYELSYLATPNARQQWTQRLAPCESDIRSSLRATEHDGRPAWHFECFNSATDRLSMSVDEQLGLVLRSEHAPSRRVREWRNVEIRTDLGPSFFAT